MTSRVGIRQHRKVIALGQGFGQHFHAFFPRSMHNDRISGQRFDDEFPLLVNLFNLFCRTIANFLSNQIRITRQCRTGHIIADGKKNRKTAYKQGNEACQKFNP